MTNSGAREQLFYEAPRGTRITSIKTTDIEKMNWFTWTGVLGLVCEGIWPPETDITDINSTDLTKDKQILATADDFGLVKLFDFPAKVNRIFDKMFLFVLRLDFFILFFVNLSRENLLNLNVIQVIVLMSLVFDGLTMIII